VTEIEVGVRIRLVGQGEMPPLPRVVAEALVAHHAGEQQPVRPHLRRQRAIVGVGLGIEQIETRSHVQLGFGAETVVVLGNDRQVDGTAAAVPGPPRDVALAEQLSLVLSRVVLGLAALIGAIARPGEELIHRALRPVPVEDLEAEAHRRQLRLHTREGLGCLDRQPALAVEVAVDGPAHEILVGVVTNLLLDGRIHLGELHEVLTNHGRSSPGIGPQPDCPAGSPWCLSAVPLPRPTRGCTSGLQRLNPPTL